LAGFRDDVTPAASPYSHSAVIIRGENGRSPRWSLPLGHPLDLCQVDVLE
jgi:hypothetical protein